MFGLAVCTWQLVFSTTQSNIIEHTEVLFIDYPESFGKFCCRD